MSRSMASRSTSASFDEDGDRCGDCWRWQDRASHARASGSDLGPGFQIQDCFARLAPTSERFQPLRRNALDRATMRLRGY